MAGKAKPKKTAGKNAAAAAKPPAKQAAGRGAAPKADLDRRWSILLFGLGLLVALLSFIPGENGWSWARQWLLFGALGAGGWLLGPMLLWWAVLIGLEKPVISSVIKGILFLFTASGAALVFGDTAFLQAEGLDFGGLLTALMDTGWQRVLGGGLASILFGYSLLALTGVWVSRVLLVLLVLVAVMLITGVTPGDIVRFFRRLGSRGAGRYKADAAIDEPAEAPDEALLPPLPPRGKHRAQRVDIPLQAPGEQAQPVQPPPRVAVYNMPPPGEAPPRRMRAHDIDLGPSAPKSAAGGAEHVARAGIGPGGTFGLPPEPSGPEEYGLGDYVPLVPFSPRSAEPPISTGGDVLLFGEHDPYANLGGAASKLPRGTLLDVEYVPPADGSHFDLFGGKPEAPAPAPLPQAQMPNGPIPPGKAQTPGDEPPFEVRQTLAGAQAAGTRPRLAGEATGSTGTDVAQMIEKAAAAKQAPAAAQAGQQGAALYKRPPLDKFDAQPRDNLAGVREEMTKTADLLVSTLESFGVQTRILDVSRGPSVTRYEVQPQAGVKISRITGLSDDIALNLAAAGVRIEAPIPGKPAVGIEVPNRVKSTVSIRGILESEAFEKASSPLSIALGKDIAGDVVVADLTRMPHLLIAGSTGSGKSVCINSVIMSFLYKSSPEDVKMILIDPKVVELAEYNGIPHLMIPVVTEPRQAAKALGHAVAMMEQRYHLFAELGVRDITSFNKLAKRDGTLEKMPHIAIVIDELADLMMVAGKDVETFICRIAQKARAAGMHLIVATQRPSVDVITGLIKANIPSRIAFAVSSQVDSRTILDGAGAEKLLGMGDMLFMPIGANKPVRVQGTYVKDREISRVLEYLKQNATAEYDENVLAEMEKVALSGSGGSGGADEEGMDDADLLRDATFVAAVETALESGSISTSFLQRRLRLGYARAGRIMDQMEQMHIISPPEGSKPRQVLITGQQWHEMVINRGE